MELGPKPERVIMDVLVKDTLPTPVMMTTKNEYNLNNFYILKLFIGQNY